MTQSNSQPPDSDQLRVLLAAERTMLAWLRTGLAMMGFGFIVARFGVFLHELALVQETHAPPSPRLSLWFGTALIALGVVINVVSALEYYRLVRSVRRGDVYAIPSAKFSIGLSLVLALLGTGMAWYVVHLSL